MISISVIKRGKDILENWTKYIQSNKLMSEISVVAIDVANKTVDNMRDTIAENKKRPSLGDNLEKTIDKEILKDTPYAFEIGIGNINKLKTDAPYFEVLDAGGYVPYSTVKAAPPGSFEGDSAIKGGDGQNWERSGGKGLYMKPKKAIEGIDYIGKGIRFCEILLMTKISEVWKRWGSGFGGKG